MHKTANEIADIVLDKLSANEDDVSLSQAGTLGGSLGGGAGSILGAMRGGAEAPFVGGKALTDFIGSPEDKLYKGPGLNPKRLTVGGKAVSTRVLKRLLQGAGTGTALGAGTAIGGTALYNHLKNQEEEV